MADNKEIKKFRGGVRLDPQGTPPTNPEKGTVYIDTDGKQYVYDGTSVWVESIDSKNAQTIGGAKNFSDPITLDHESTPSTPASGKVTVYAKDDNQLHILNSDGSEVPIGSGGAGGLDTFFTDDFSTSLANLCKGAVAESNPGPPFPLTISMSIPDLALELALLEKPQYASATFLAV